MLDRKPHPFFARNFGHGPSGRQIVFLDWITQGPDDSLARGVGFNISQILCDSLSSDGQAITVQQSGVQQCLHQRSNPANGDQFGHKILAARL